MKKVILCLFVVSLLSVLVLENVSAWFPNIHTYIIDKIDEKSTELQNLSACFDNSINEKAIRAGNLLPDITAIDYASTNQNYKATHSWNFQEKLLSEAKTQEETCFAYGVALHLIADNVSHSQLIPLMMQKTGLPELIIHPLTEEKYDAWIVSLNKELIDETKKTLDIFYSKDRERFIEQIENSFDETTNLNVEKKIKELNVILRVLNGIVTTDSFAMGFARIVNKNQNIGAGIYVQKSISSILERFG